MKRWFQRLGVLACGVALLCGLSGCHRHKHREVRTHEETREGPVQESPPGEMVVE